MKFQKTYYVKCSDCSNVFQVPETKSLGIYCVRCGSSCVNYCSVPQTLFGSGGVKLPSSHPWNEYLQSETSYTYDHSKGGWVQAFQSAVPASQNTIGDITAMFLLLKKIEPRNVEELTYVLFYWADKTSKHTLLGWSAEDYFEKGLKLQVFLDKATEYKVMKLRQFQYRFN